MGQRLLSIQNPLSHGRVQQLAAVAERAFSNAAALPANPWHQLPACELTHLYSRAHPGSQTPAGSQAGSLRHRSQRNVPSSPSALLFVVCGSCWSWSTVSVATWWRSGQLPVDQRPACSRDHAGVRPVLLNKSQHGSLDKSLHSSNRHPPVTVPSRVAVPSRHGSPAVVALPPPLFAEPHASPRVVVGDFAAGSHRD